MLDQPVACLCLRSFYSVEVLKLVHHCRALGLKDMQRVLLVVDILSCRTRTYVHVICILICNMVHIYVHVHVHHMCVYMSIVYVCMYVYIHMYILIDPRISEGMFHLLMQ
jgi:hypothetical protein